MAEIKISDLSIGDWIEIDGEPAKTLCLRIAGGHIFKGISGQMYRCCGGMDFEPIPITPEILEKNGFVKKNYDNGKMWDWWCDNVLVRKFADEDIYRFIVAFNSKHYTTMMVVGKHTHQLQHALRLAGVEKEIEL